MCTVFIKLIIKGLCLLDRSQVGSNQPPLDLGFEGLIRLIINGLCVFTGHKWVPISLHLSWELLQGGEKLFLKYTFFLKLNNTFCDVQNVERGPRSRTYVHVLDTPGCQ
jgi:predicted ABC-type exoprotein transport system permease subunit